jgi:hypothetical protein
MRYVLITKTGKVMVFHVKAVAELYLTINGGVICSESEEKVIA